MKNKTKVIVGLAAMLAGTIGVAGVSTFAWFATQNNAELTFADAVVRGDSTHISVDFATTQPDNSAIVDGQNDVAVTKDLTNHSYVHITGASTKVVDLSGNGKNFFRPMNYKKNGYTSSGVTTSATGVKSITQNAEGSTFFVTFNITITNNSDLPTDVYLDGVSITTSGDVTTQSEQAALAARYAIWQGVNNSNGYTDGQSVIRTLSSPNGSGNNHYLSMTQNGDTTNSKRAFGLTGETIPFENVIATTGTLTDEEKVFTRDTTYAVPDTSTTSAANLFTDTTIPTSLAAPGGYICNLPTLNNAKTINISMWIEGTDDAGDEDCIAGKIKLDIKLAGIQRTVEP